MVNVFVEPHRPAAIEGGHGWRTGKKRDQEMNGKQLYMIITGGGINFVISQESSRCS